MKRYYESQVRASKGESQVRASKGTSPEEGKKKRVVSRRTKVCFCCTINYHVDENYFGFTAVETYGGY